MENEYMTDKQYDGMLKDQIAMLDRLAKLHADDEKVLYDIYCERTLLTSKLGCDVDEHNLYDKIKSPEK